MIIQNRDRLGIVYYNTALSSAKATHGGTVVSREADIVTAHGNRDLFSLILSILIYSMTS